MTLGLADRQGNLLDDVSGSATRRSDEHSIYSFLHRERDRLFPDEVFADLFDERGPALGAAVGGGDGDGAAAPRGPVGPRGGRALLLRHPLALRGGRRRLRHRRVDELRPHRARRHARAPAAARSARTASSRPPSSAAKEAGLVGRRRALDSTPLYDAVATMDTVTLIRSAIRGLLKVADDELEAELRGAVSRRRRLRQLGQAPDRLGRRRGSRGAHRLPGQGRLCAASPLLDGRKLDPPVAEAAKLLATVVGQDLERATTASSASPGRWPRTG